MINQFLFLFYISIQIHKWISFHLLSYHLSKCGYKIFTAENGKVALEKINPIPDLMVVDVMMPEMNGPQFLGEIKN